VWSRPVEGLLITTAASLALVNSFDVARISTMGSAGFLVIFGAVNLAAWRLTESRVLAVFGVAGCLAALVALCAVTLDRSPADLVVLGVLMGLALLIEWAYRLATGREIRLEDGEGDAPPL
jgi:hypothetical protein